MKILNMTCPPLPHFIAAGSANYGETNKHPTRQGVGVFDLILVRSGTLYIGEEDRRYKLEKDHYLILSPETKHIGYKYSKPSTTFYWLHFYTNGDYLVCDEEVVIKSVDPIIHVDSFPKECPFMISIPCNGHLDPIIAKEVEGKLKNLATVHMDLFNERIMIDECPLFPISQQEVFVSILDILKLKEDICDLRDIPNMVTGYIKSNFNKQFTLKDMADEFSFHPNYITRVMREKTGTTPMEFLMNYRINYSKYLLSHSHFSIKKIATESGFSSPAYFTKTFKSRTGMLPTEYRAKLNP